MKKVWISWFISFAAALLCTIINIRFFRVSEMINLEFSTSAEMMRTHIMSIGCSAECCYHTLLMNTIVDFGFLVSYSLLTYVSFKLLLDVFQVSFKPWIYILSFTVGFLDIIENCFLLKTAIDQKEAYSDLFCWVVRIKWGFAIVPLLLVPMVMLYCLVLLLRTRQVR